MSDENTYHAIQAELEAQSDSPAIERRHADLVLDTIIRNMGFWEGCPSFDRLKILRLRDNIDIVPVVHRAGKLQLLQEVVQREPELLKYPSYSVDWRNGMVALAYHIVHHGTPDLMVRVIDMIGKNDFQSNVHDLIWEISTTDNHIDRPQNFLIALHKLYPRLSVKFDGAEEIIEQNIRDMIGLLFRAEVWNTDRIVHPEQFEEWEDDVFPEDIVDLVDG